MATSKTWTSAPQQLKSGQAGLELLLLAPRGAGSSGAHSVVRKYASATLLTAITTLHSSAEVQ